jgi:PAS domain S-box-containing protein
MDLAQAQAILERTHSAFVSMDTEGRIAYWNARAEEMFGHTRERVVGRDLADTIIPERFRERHRAALRAFLASGRGEMIDRRVELSALRADGSEFPIEITISALADSGGWTFHAFIADVSERVAAARERERLLGKLQQALHGTEERLSVTLDALAEAVTIRAPDDHLIYANRAALRRMDLDSIDELREADPRALMADYETTDERGRPIAMEDLPSVRLLRGEQPEPLMLRSVDRRTGQELWSLLKTAAVRGHDGSMKAAVTIIEDVTASKRAALRSEYIGQVSEMLASSLDYEQTLRNVAGLAVPQIADWCAVDLFDEEGRREHVAVAHAEAEKTALAHRLRARMPSQLDPDSGLGRVRSTRMPLLVPEVTDEMLVASAIDPEQLRLLRAVGMRSVLVVPMLIRGEAIGALTLVSAESARIFDDDDVRFAEQIAERAARAVENSRLYTERTEVARTLQRSLLPEALPTIPGWEISALYQPAGHGNEVGGDFYDVWEIDASWIVMIGDVTGKGVGAAAMTSLVRHTARTASEFDPRPGRVLGQVDTALRRSATLSVCTALCLRIAGDDYTIAVGGHPLPLCLGPAGVREVGTPGTLLGAFDAPSVAETSFAMRPGETLVAITDGVTDAIGQGGERFGQERLLAVLAEVREAPPRTVLERLAQALEQFQVGAQADDTAAVVLRLLEPAAQPRRVEDHELTGARAGSQE